MPLLGSSHAKEKKKGEEVGKLLRRQIPPLFDALMLIHSERTSCLSACTSAFLSVSSDLLLSSCFTASFNSLCFVLVFELLCPYAFSFVFFFPVHQFLPTSVPWHPIIYSRICHYTLQSSCNINSRLKTDRMLVSRSIFLQD